MQLKYEYVINPVHADYCHKLGSRDPFWFPGTPGVPGTPGAWVPRGRDQGCDFVRLHLIFEPDDAGVVSRGFGVCEGRFPAMGSCRRVKSMKVSQRNCYAPMTVSLARAVGFSQSREMGEGPVLSYSTGKRWNKAVIVYVNYD